MGIEEGEGQLTWHSGYDEKEIQTRFKRNQPNSSAETLQLNLSEGGCHNQSVLLVRG
jgi:hypothetical protein